MVSEVISSPEISPLETFFVGIPFKKFGQNGSTYDDLAIFYLATEN
jgi:hypothetical protein